MFISVGNIVRLTKRLLCLIKYLTWAFTKLLLCILAFFMSLSLNDSVDELLSQSFLILFHFWFRVWNFIRLNVIFIVIKAESLKTNRFTNVCLAQLDFDQCSFYRNFFEVDCTLIGLILCFELDTRSISNFIWLHFDFDNFPYNFKCSVNVVCYCISI